MENEYLKRLKPAAGALFESVAFAEGYAPDLKEYEEDFPRNIALGSLSAVIARAMERPGDPSASDGWLAPRVHATLRLTRREASDRGMWEFLSWRFADYVRWRWTDKNGKVSAERVLGQHTNRNAFARMWWAAELTRNGSSYDPTSRVFQNQTAVQWLLDIRAFHNRPAALGYIAALGTTPTDKLANETGKALNHLLTTYALDVLAPDTGPDMDAINEWIREAPDETLMFGESLPDGPWDAPSDTRAIECVMALLGRVAHSAEQGFEGSET